MSDDQFHTLAVVQTRKSRYGLAGDRPSMAVVRERERGTLEQLLVSPLSRWGLMLGKLVPYLCIGMLMAILLFAIMRRGKAQAQRAECPRNPMARSREAP